MPDNNEGNNYKGLSNEEVLESRKIHGRNEIAQEEKVSLFKSALKFFSEPVFLLLIGASLIYFALGEPRDGAVMLVFVAFMGSINLYQEWRTDKTLEALRNLSSPKVSVIREGEKEIIPSEELVPGDIMLLSEGEKISADGEILFSDGFGVDESTLTGESDIVWKLAAPSFLAERHWRLDHCYSGTNAITGRAIVRVTATGSTTEYGKIGADVAAAPDRPTPLEKQTRKLVRNCSGFSFAMMLLVVCATLNNGSNFIDAVLSGITIAMATIPEEFPVVLTVFLAMGAWRIARRNALIRRIPSVETLGAVTVLCVDKTGTLTQNRMGIRELVPLIEKSYSELLEASVMASETNPYDPMEIALINKAESEGLDVAMLQNRNLLYEYPFSSEARMMGHIWDVEGKKFLAAKGSPENIFKLCRLTETEKLEAEAEQNRLSDMGCRVLAIAVNSSLDNIPSALTDCSLELVGLAAFIDPPREAVPAAVAACRSAGIRIAIVTGDNSVTAHRIAHEIGLGTAGENEHQIITGDELESLDNGELTERLRHVTIFSRILPREKMRIIKAFKAAGEVVAMTGDGVNDAPALKYADIGIAMGERGTQVAREAADMVLLNDNFTTIVDTIRDGRRIYDNICKAMEYIFVIHIPIALSALAAPLLGLPTLLLPIHVALLEMIIDPTCSIVFERQPAEPDIMKRPPRPVDSSIISKDIFVKALLQGLVIFAAVFGSFCYTLPHEGSEHARTFFLAVLVLSNLFLVYVNRSDTRPAYESKSDKFDPVPWIINLAILTGLIIISSIPALASMAKVKPLSLADFGAAAAIAACATFWWEIIKFFKRKLGFNGN
jgi:Ca2+-transporting ATPase